MAAKKRCCGGSGSYVGPYFFSKVQDTNQPRLEEAHEPESLAQETIIENMSADEAHRLSKVRNIGIAVCSDSPLST